MNISIDPKKIQLVMGLPLKTGKHDDLAKGMCVMEAVAYVAGEPWTDSPECASPVIAAFLRNWNDSLGDEQRQDLKKYIPLLVGTKGSEALENKRAMQCADWMIRHHTPAWLRLAGLNAEAEALERLPEITDFAQVPSIMPPLQAAAKNANAARDAAWAAARDAAWAAARDAAWAAARAAARAAAWDAAWDAARAAARAAAWDAARAAAWAAARAAAWDAAWAAARAAARAAAWAAAYKAVREKLQPTQDALYQSAHDLVLRMIECREAA